MGVGRRFESGTRLGATETTLKQCSQQHDQERTVLGKFSRCGGDGIQWSQLDNRILQGQT